MAGLLRLGDVGGLGMDMGLVGGALVITGDLDGGVVVCGDCWVGCSYAMI